jgi:hypothetical protein
VLAIKLARDAGVQGREAVPSLTRAVGAALALFTVTGWGLTRLLLPPGLRRYEWLWVAPIGACATSLSMMVLGFAAVPYRANLALVILGGVVLAVVALRRPRSGMAGTDENAEDDAAAVADRDPSVRAVLRRVAWPAWIAVLLIAIALIPLLRAGFATVEGQGQDAHLAVGSAIFLKHNYPTSTDISEPVDRMPLVWRSKQAIYYTLAAASSLSGLEVYETISAVAAVLLGMAALGFFLFAREVLRAPPWAAVAAMALIGIDRMVLHTVMHPYFNQTWGFFGLGFACVLSWWTVKERTRGGIALLVAFLAVITLAYPLAAPIPLIPLAIVLWPEAKRLRPKGIWKGKRSLKWMIPAAFVFLASLNVPPIKGVSEKFSTASSVVLNPAHSLRNWGGDLKGYFPEPQFIAINTYPGLILMIGPLVYVIYLCLRDLERPLRRGLTALLIFTIVFLLWFRVREFGFYFHFKLLAFVGPVALALAAAGAAKVKPVRAGILGVAVLGTMAMSAAAHEIGSTFDELPKNVLQLQEIDAALPPGQSIRLDVGPMEQNWVAFMLHGQPLCSQHPLLGTNYPHVRTSRKADYILTKRTAKAPKDALGPPVKQIEIFSLYKARPDIPGRENCSQAMVETVSKEDFKGP